MTVFYDDRLEISLVFPICFCLPLEPPIAGVGLVIYELLLFARGLCDWLDAC